MIVTRPLYKYLPDVIARMWFHHIYLSAHDYQFGWLQAVTGGVRCGKSMTIMTMADLLARKPIDEYNIGFTPKEYMKTLDYCESGEPLIWSELGTALNARKWFSLSNILIGEVLQTMMIKKPIVFIDTPDLGFIDITARKLIYAYSEAKRWERNPVMLWLYRISINRKEGKIYFPHPCFSRNGILHKIRSLRIHVMPNDEIWHYYDKKQKIYKEKLRKKNMKIIEELTREMGEQEETIYDVINKVGANIERYMVKGKLSEHVIALKEKIPVNRAVAVKKMLLLREGKSSYNTDSSYNINNKLEKNEKKRKKYRLSEESTLLKGQETSEKNAKIQG